MDLFGSFNKGKMEVLEAVSSDSSIKDSNWTSKTWIKMDVIKLKEFRLKWISTTGNQYIYTYNK